MGKSRRALRSSRVLMELSFDMGTVELLKHILSLLLSREQCHYPQPVRYARCSTGPQKCRAVVRSFCLIAVCNLCYRSKDTSRELGRARDTSTRVIKT